MTYLGRWNSLRPRSSAGRSMPLWMMPSTGCSSSTCSSIQSLESLFPVLAVFASFAGACPAEESVVGLGLSTTGDRLPVDCFCFSCTQRMSGVISRGHSCRFFGAW